MTTNLGNTYYIPGFGVVVAIVVGWEVEFVGTLGEKSDIPSSIRRNTVRNITDIPGYSVIFPWNIFAIRVIFRPEYVGINYTTYSEAEYYRNTHEKNIILWIISNEHFG